MMTETDTADATALLDELVRIGAPTGQEQRRAAFVMDWLKSAGLQEVWQDEAGSVLARLGPADRPPLLLDSHIDTVFPDESLEVRKDGEGRWHCPGIFDNTATCALLMVYARRLMREGRTLPLLLSFTVGEEGEGDLRGIRQVTDDWEGKISAALVLDLREGCFSRRCVGSTRWRIAFEAEGGHSWSQFGRPSAVHAACRWVASLEQARDWANGTLTYNVGRLTGGQSVNAIAGQAELLLDLRALDPEVLASAEAMVRSSLEAIDDVKVTPQEIGRRPAAVLEENHPLVTATLKTHERLGLPLEEKARSTNANWPAHRGVPSICVGLLTGDHIHTRAEYLDIASVGSGLTLLEALVDAVAAEVNAPT